MPDSSVRIYPLVAALAGPFDLQDNQLHVGTSIGIKLYPNDGTDPDVLLRNADLALYHAKRDGRGQYRFYDREMDVELKATRSVEAGLRRAIENGDLELRYQPSFALGDGRAQGVEALIRWHHPGGGYALPTTFIPIAGSSGLIVPLGEWVLREACRQAQSWQHAGCRLRVAINVSAVCLRQPRFACLVERILDEGGLPGAVLELEVTERVFVDPSKAAITKALQEVTELGVRLAPSTISARVIPVSAISSTSRSNDQDRRLLRARHRRRN